MYFKGPSDFKSQLQQCCEEIAGEVVDQEDLLCVLGVGEESKSLVSRQVAQVFPTTFKTRIRRDGKRMYPHIINIFMSTVIIAFYCDIKYI